jgi:hypothetical protein
MGMKWLLPALGLFLLGACGAAGGGNADASGAAGASCPPLAPSDPIFGCPATFAAHDLSGCAGMFPSWAGTCGSYQVDYRTGLDSYLCAYDAQGALVVARHCTDHNVNWACGGFCRSSADAIDFEGVCNLSEKLRCPVDGGAH